MEKTINIVVVPGVGYSHLVPILQLSKLLVKLHPYLHVTCLIPTLGSPPTSSKTILQTLPSNINYTFLPPVNLKNLGTTLEMQLQLTISHSLPSIHQALKSLVLRTRLVALIVDSFAVEALDFAKEFNLLSYIYYPGAASTLSLSLYLPKLDNETSCEYRDLSEPVKIPGCVPLNGRDLYAPAQDRSIQAYKLLLERVKKFHFVDEILVNSFLEMETGPIKALKEEGSDNPPVFPVGPIIQTGTNSGDGLECLAWLDKQQPCSVLYVSFGSGGTLSQEQIVELALGLELSNQKFLWVVRAPNSSSSSAAYLSVSAQNDVDDPLQFLPPGFIERAKGQGMVIPSWSPQIQILGHISVGGFLTHCGWNSTLESVMHGVPLVTWPLFAEQRMNAVLLSEGLKVGLRPRVRDYDLVKSGEIAKLIKCLMEGEEGGKLRNNMKELQEAATNALKDGGASTKIIYQLALKWRNLVQENQL